MVMTKKVKSVWKTRNGTLVEVTNMTNAHLSNSIKMVARSCLSKGLSVKDLKKHSKYKELMIEAAKREFHVNYLESPNISRGKAEWVEVVLPSPHSRISPSFFPVELDTQREV